MAPDLPELSKTENKVAVEIDLTDEEVAEAVLFLVSERASYITDTNLHLEGRIDTVGQGNDSA